MFLNNELIVTEKNIEIIPLKIQLSLKDFYLKKLKWIMKILTWHGAFTVVKSGVLLSGIY